MKPIVVAVRDDRTTVRSEHRVAAWPVVIGSEPGCSVVLADIGNRAISVERRGHHTMLEVLSEDRVAIARERLAQGQVVRVDDGFFHVGYYTISVTW